MGPRVPSPGQVEEAAQRMFSFSKITFEVDIHGWRTVYLSGMRPIKTPNVRRVMLSFECHPLVSTPYMPDIPGTFFLVEDGLRTRRISWMREIEGKTYHTVTGFRATNDSAVAWLRLKFAQAAGKRFREHSILTPTGGKWIYTEEA